MPVRAAPHRFHITLCRSAAALFSLVQLLLFCCGPDRPASAATSGQTAYCVQVIVLSARGAAETYAAELRQKGYDASVAETPAKDGTMLYRVRIGCFSTESEARRFGLLFSDTEKKPHVVMKVTDVPAPPDTAPRKPTVVPQPPSPPAAARDDNATLEELPDETDLPAEAVEPLPSAGDAAKHPEQPAPDDVPAPHRTSAAPEPVAAGSTSVIKIFAYRQTDGTLRLTNNYFSIPDNARANIEYLSVFPVEFLSCDATASHVLCSIDGSKKPVRIAGVALPSGASAALVTDYFTRQIKKAPLRLRYNPWNTGADGIIIGRFYLREGTFLNLELLKNGIGKYCADTAPPDQRAALQKAEEQARREKKGIWAGH